MEENNNEEEYYIGYKINTKNTYKVYKNSYNGKDFYKIQVKKKNYDGTSTSFYKQIRFVKCTPPEDGEIIKIHKGFEDLYINSVDKYNCISVVVITEYEKVFNEVVNQEQAYARYQESLNEEEDIPEITDEDLPF
ncbi:hypothetical protein [Megamonas funiformis]|uniref:hypothetical protein n=1 Tax=Megamonas funiformis TaxID=437897 RepID=UPI003F7D184A